MRTVYVLLAIWSQCCTSLV